MGTNVLPPALAIRFLHLYCKEELVEELEGSFYEYFNERKDRRGLFWARWFFWLDVVLHCRPYVWKTRKRQNSNHMLGNHLKVSIRSLRKNPLNTSLNIIGLATGLASFILINLWIDNELSWDQFHDKKERIYRIPNTFRSEAETFSQAVSGPALGAQLHHIFSEVNSATRLGRETLQIKMGDEVYFQSDIGLVDPTFLDIFSFPNLVEDQETPLDELGSIVITKSLATKYFGDENPIGKELALVEGNSLKVTGVVDDVPETSQIQFQALVSMETIRRIWGSNNYDDNWGGGWFHTYLLLEEGVDVAQLEKDITAFIREKLSSWAEQGMYYDYFLQPLTSIHLKSDLRYDFLSNGSLQQVLVFRWSAIVILLLACINYINISTANTVYRSKQVGLRKVLGAGKGSIMGQMLVETFTIVLLSTALAYLLAYLMLPLVSAITSYDQLNLFEPGGLIRIGGVVLALSLLSGAVPAFTIAKYNALKVIRGTLRTGTELGLLRKGLVVAQFIATGVLLISMIVIQNQMNFIQKQSLGMKTNEVMHISFQGSQEVQQRASVIRDRLLSLPEVRDLSFLHNSYPVDGLSNSGAEIETADGTFIRSSIYTLRVDNHFKETFGLELASGRFFSDEFPADSTRSVLVNEATVANFGWGSPEQGIGKKFGQAPNQRTVVGVVRDFNFEGLHKPIEPVRILPTTADRYTTLAVRFKGDNTLQVINSLQSAWDEVVPSIPLDLSMMSDDIKRQYSTEYNFRTIFVAFSIISIIIGCLGLFGLVTATVNQRLKEISVRKVLGASVLSILVMINTYFVQLIAIATIVAVPISYYMMQNWLNDFSYHVSFSWWYVFLAITGIMAITVLTISSNAIKTVRRNPAEVLQDE